MKGQTLNNPLRWIKESRLKELALFNSPYKSLGYNFMLNFYTLTILRNFSIFLKLPPSSPDNLLI